MLAVGRWAGVVDALAAGAGAISCAAPGALTALLTALLAALLAVGTAAPVTDVDASDVVPDLVAAEDAAVALEPDAVDPLDPFVVDPPDVDEADVGCCAVAVLAEAPDAADPADADWFDAADPAVPPDGVVPPDPAAALVAAEPPPAWPASVPVDGAAASAGDWSWAAAAGWLAALPPAACVS